MSRFECLNPPIYDWLLNQEAIECEVEYATTSAKRKDVKLPTVLQPFMHLNENRIVDLNQESSANDKRRRFGRAQQSSRSEHTKPKDIGGQALTSKDISKMNFSFTDMTDSSKLISEQNCAELLWDRYQQDGYLYFRNVLDNKAVIDARAIVVQGLRKMKVADQLGNPILKQGMTISRHDNYIIGGSSQACDGDITQQTNVLTTLCGDRKIDQLLKSETIYRIIQLLCEGKSQAEKHKFEAFSLDPAGTWLRVKAPKEFTPLHADWFYYKVSYGQYYVAILMYQCLLLHVEVRRQFFDPIVPCHNHINAFVITLTLQYFTDMFEGYKEPGKSCCITKDIDTLTCAICKKSGGCCSSKTNDKSSKLSKTRTMNPSAMLLRCDECYKHYHIQCLPRHYVNTSMIPTDEWYCPYCSIRPVLGTCWIPLGNVSVTDGSLQLLPGTMKLPQFDKFVYSFTIIFG